MSNKVHWSCPIKMTRSQNVRGLSHKCMRSCSADRICQCNQSWPMAFLYLMGWCWPCKSWRVDRINWLGTLEVGPWWMRNRLEWWSHQELACTTQWCEMRGNLSKECRLNVNNLSCIPVATGSSPWGQSDHQLDHGDLHPWRCRPGGHSPHWMM